MKTFIFRSGFKDLLLDYIDMNIDEGRTEKYLYYSMRLFDDYCFARHQDQLIFTQDDADHFYEAKPENMRQITFYGYSGKVADFTRFLVAMDYDIACVEQIGRGTSSFVPHIYTEDETLRYTEAADNYDDPRFPYLSIALPVMMRTLQCVGLRVGELLELRKSDVILDAECPHSVIRDPKNSIARLVPMSDSLHTVYCAFYNMWMHRLQDNDFIFVTSSGKPFTHSQMYSIHLNLLLVAEIPYHGNGQGPRLHDWRHTFCVNSFNKMINEGISAQNALPYLSKIMGHQHFSATEKYLRMTAANYSDVIRALDEIYEDAQSKWR